MRYLILLPLLILPLVLTACDGVTDEPDVSEATFEATLQGAVDARLEGEAWLFNSAFGLSPFGDDLDSLFQAFASTTIMLDAVVDDGALHGIMLNFFGDEPPAPGTYALNQSVPEADSLSGFFFPYGQTSAASPFATYTVTEADRHITYALTAGTVEITAASGEAIRGALTMEADRIYVFTNEDLEVPTWSPFPGRPGRPLFEPESEDLKTPLRLTGSFSAKLTRPDRRPR